MHSRMSSRISYDRYGNSYNVTAIINEDATLNVAQYEAYSPLFLSTVFAMSYGLSFASITSTLMHTILYFRKQIWTQSRRSMSEQPDIHARLMSYYRQVPEWWYAIILCTFPQFHFLSCTSDWLVHSVHVCIWHYLYRSLAYPVSRLGVCSESYHWYCSAVLVASPYTHLGCSLSHSIYLLHPGRHDSSYH